MELIPLGSLIFNFLSHMKTRSKESLGVLLVLFATLLLSFRSILVKYVYMEGVSIMDLFFFRFVFTIPILLAFSFWRKRWTVITTLKSKRLAFGCLAAGFFGYYMATLMDFHSLKILDANVNRIIVYAFPIYVLLLNSIIERRLPKLLDVIVFLLVQGGLFFVLGGVGISLSYSDRMGVLFAVLASLSYSAYIIINQQIGKKIGSILFTTYALTFSFVFLSIHYLATLSEPVGQTLTTPSVGYIVIMAIFCTFLPLLLISEGIRRIGAPRFSLINSTGPVMTIGFAFIFLGERMTLQQILGASVVIGILALYESYKRKKYVSE